MADLIDRDTNGMQQFVNKANQTETNIRNICSQLDGCLSFADSVMLDSDSKKAVAKLQTLIKFINDYLPHIEDSSKVMSKSIHHIQMAKEIIK